MIEIVKIGQYRRAIAVIFALKGEGIMKWLSLAVLFALQQLEPTPLTTRRQPVATLTSEPQRFPVQKAQ